MPPRSILRSPAPRALMLALVLCGGGACLEIDDPTIVRVTPTEGQVGTEVLIEGENFVETFSQTRIFFGGAQVSPSTILEVTDTRLRVLVPSGAVTGDLLVEVGGVESVRTPFTVFGDWVAVGSPGNRSVSLVDTVTGLVEGLLRTGAPAVDAEFSPGGTEAWILAQAEDGSAEALRLDSAQRTLDTRLAINRDPVSIAYDPIPPDLTDDPDEPVRTEAWVLSGTDPILEVIRSEILPLDIDEPDPDAPTEIRDVRARVELPAPARDLAFSPDGSKGYMIEPSRSALLVVDASIPVPFGLAETPIDPRAGPIIVSVTSGVAYVLEQSPAQVSEIDPTDFTVRQTFPVGADPADLLLSGNLLFVSSPTDGVIDVFDVSADEEAGDQVVIGEIVAGGAPRQLALLATTAGTRLFALVETDGVVRVRGFDPLTLEEVVVRDVAPAPSSLEPVLSTGGSFLYLTHDGDPGLVTLIEEPDGLVRTFALSGGAQLLAQQP